MREGCTFRTFGRITMNSERTQVKLEGDLKDPIVAALYDALKREYGTSFTPKDNEEPEAHYGGRTLFGARDISKVLLGVSLMKLLGNRRL